MSTLILNANTASPITVVCQRAGKGVPRRVGSKTYSFAGAERSSVRGQAKVIPITTSYVDTATEALIQNAGYNGAALPCSGDILGNIQTVCSFENVVSNMMPGLPGFFEMSFTLNEVQASVVLLKYAPGDTITGESFTRSTVATYFNAAGVLTDAAINVKRDSHYGPYPSAGPRMLLLEDGRTNQVLWSSDFSNGAWVKTNLSVATGVPGMRSGTSACTLTATSAVGDVHQFLSAGSSIVRTNSIWMRRRTGTGQVELYAADGTTFVIPALTANYQRVQIPGPATTARKFEIVLRISGDAIDVENAQLEDGAFMSSEIQTTTVAVTRAADSYSLPFTTPPQEMTVYAKFVEGGTAISAVGKRLWEISNSAGAFPLFMSWSASGQYGTYHSNGITSLSATLAAGPIIGDTDELLSHLFGDGSVEAVQSLNGAGSSTSGQSGSLQPLAPAWAGLLIWLNSGGSSDVGFTALQSFKILAGARSLAEMRAA